MKDTLWYVQQQSRNEIMQLSSQLADIVGLATLQKLNISIPENTELGNSQQLSSPFILLFNVLIIKLLAVATLGTDQTLNQYYLIDNNQALCFASQKIMVSAAEMKKQVQAFREKVLSEDTLCSHVMAALTD